MKIETGKTSSNPRTWSPDQVQIILRGAQRHHYYAAFMLSATTGVRRGEVLGLRWADVDLDSGRLEVRQTRVKIGKKTVESSPKTERIRLSLALDRQLTEAVPSSG